MKAGETGNFCTDVSEFHCNRQCQSKTHVEACKHTTQARDVDVDLHRCYTSSNYFSSYHVVININVFMPTSVTTTQAGPSKVRQYHSKNAPRSELRAHEQPTHDVTWMRDSGPNFILWT